MEINASVSILVASLVPLVVALTGVCNFGYTIIRDKISNKKENLQNTKSMLDRMDEIRNSKKYLQDLEIDKITFLRGFNWQEAEVILNRDLHLLTISELRSLKRDKLLIISNNSIIVPSKKCIIKYKFRKIKTYVILANFIFSFLIVAWSIFTYSLFSMISLALYIYMLFSEMLAVYLFDSILSFNSIKESEDIANNNIVISENFARERQR